MSRATVRTAIATFLSGANITGLVAVYQTMPMFFSGEQLAKAADGPISAWAWIDLAESSEERWSVPAMWAGRNSSGDKGVHYEVAVILEYRYQTQQGIATPVSPDAWVQGEDAIIQGILDRIHSDAALGAPAVILAAAQERGSLRVSGDNPIVEPGVVLSTHSIEFRVTEAIEA